jgi:hypothetical protein
MELRVNGTAAASQAIQNQAVVTDVTFLLSIVTREPIMVSSTAVVRITTNPSILTLTQTLGGTITLDNKTTDATAPVAYMTIVKVR